MKETRVSVLMPVYNGGEYLRSAVESILNQSYKDFEFIIVDDGSQDKTQDILLEYQIRDSRIKIITSDRNLGLVESLNKGIKECKGEFIARMDSDDISLPLRLELQVAYLDSNPSISIVGTGMELFQADEQRSSRIVQHPLDTGSLHWSMFFNCSIGHPTVMIRRAVFDFFSYSPSYRHSEDYELWLNIISHSEFKMANLEEVLLRLRKHPQSVSKLYRVVQASNMLLIGQKYIGLVIGGDAYLEDVKTMIFPTNIFEIEGKSAQGGRASGAVLLIEKLEAALCNKSHFPEKEKATIRCEASKRIGEIATLALSKGLSCASLFSKWAARNPQQQIQSFMSLLGGTGSLFSSSPTAVDTPQTTESTYRLNVICFSKDRAFQLKEFLRTIQTILLASPAIVADISVLYTYSNDNFQKSYAKVQNLFPGVKFVQETSFNQQVKLMVDEASDYIMFAVDDIIFYSAVDISPALGVMRRNKQVIGLYLKLNPKLTVCHTANHVMQVPKTFTRIGQSPDLVSWNMKSGCTHDWDYPFDLCGTVYRKADIQMVLLQMGKLFGGPDKAYSHPNLLEANGNRYSIRKLFGDSPVGICPAKPVSSVITVNRVQDVFKNRIYEEQEKDVTELDNLLWEGENVELDESYYLKTSFDSVHIGDFVLKTNK